MTEEPAYSPIDSVTVDDHADKGVFRIAWETGASLIEYAFLVALIALVCLAAVTFLGSETSDRYSRLASEVQEAGN